MRSAVDSLAVEPLIDRIHVVDDGSTDGSTDGLADRSPKVVIHVQDNAGPSAARNRGIESALRDSAMTHVFCLDADDTLEPGGVDREFSAIAHHAGAVAAVGGRYECSADDPDSTVLHLPPEQWADRRLADPAIIFAPKRFFGASGLLIAREPLDAGLRFDPDLRVGEDRDLLYKLSKRGDVVIVGAAILRVTIHTGGTNLTGPGGIERWLRDNLVLIERYADEPGVGQQMCETSRWLLGHACRVLARQGKRIDDDLWRAYRDAFRNLGWRMPIRALKWRYVLTPVHRLRCAFLRSSTT